MKLDRAAILDEIRFHYKFENKAIFQVFRDYSAKSVKWG